MNILTSKDIVDGLRKIGVKEGDRVLVHSSLVALGQVEGGPDAVIDALLEAVGPKGLLVLPTFSCKAPFDRKTSATGLGKIADTFWRRPEAVRSLHPTHSVAAIGVGAEELIKDHEKAPTAYAEGTPYVRLAEMGGKILLLGVDQDRNTTLHSGEALAGAPYLRDIESTYIDDDGREITIPVKAMAGPHRDFIGLDRIFRECDVMSVGLIGKATCRLMDVKGMLEVEIEHLHADPAAVLCHNPSCADCVMQRGKIKAARLADESFTLSAVASDISDNPQEVIAAITGQGIKALELRADQYPQYVELLTKAGVRLVAIRGSIGDTFSAELAGKLGVPLIVPVLDSDDIQLAAAMKGQVLIENDGPDSSLLTKAYKESTNLPLLAFNPRSFAAVGENPFLKVFYRGTLRKQTAHFCIDDGTFGGKSTMPGRGNGEVKEIISMLRCRGYEGVMTLRSHAGGTDSFRETADWFWNLLDTM